MTDITDIHDAITALSSGFRHLQGRCPYPFPMGDNHRECKHPLAEGIIPECFIEECPLLHDTDRALPYVNELLSDPLELKPAP